MRPSLMDQYFAPRFLQRMKSYFFSTRKRYTDPPENMRLFYHIISDPTITDLS